ncbi:helix-turn-helix domain-containing protein [Enterococcus innesii]|uniref:helix-turn-helix domain-containing protein n=1 Tax=Enterococcus innesii TaxID=2839759 RepID=UPI003984D908
MSVDKNALGNRINQIRVSRNETLEEFAEQIKKQTNQKIKTTKSNVSKWEKGLNTPNSITLKAIADLGKVDVNYLLYGHTDLKGNQLAIRDLALYRYEVSDCYDTHRPTKSNTMFIYLAIKLVKSTNMKFSIIRITVSLSKNGISELFIENCPGFYEITSSIDGDNFLISTPIRNDLDNCVNFNAYINARKSIASDSVNELFTNIKKYVSVLLDQPFDSNSPLYYIDQNNKLSLL